MGAPLPVTVPLSVAHDPAIRSARCTERVIDVPSGKVAS
jgi:hypothetical protein